MENVWNSAILTTFFLKKTQIFSQLLIICKKISTFALTKRTTEYETN